MNPFAKRDDLQSAYEREIHTNLVPITSPSHAGEGGGDSWIFTLRDLLAHEDWHAQTTGETRA